MTESEMNTAKGFLQSIGIEHCVTIADKAHWLHEDVSSKTNPVQLFIHPALEEASQACSDTVPLIAF